MIQAIVGALCGVALFYILADLYAIPYLKTSKAVENLSKQQKDKTSGLDVWLKNLATWLSKHLKLNEFKRAQLEADLRTAQMDISPEMFKANAIVKALIIGVFAIPEMGRFYRNVLIKKNYPHHGAVAFGHYGKAIFDVLKYLGVEDVEFNRPKGVLYDGENPYAKY